MENLINLSILRKNTTNNLTNIGIRRNIEINGIFTSEFRIPLLQT